MRISRKLTHTTLLFSVLALSLIITGWQAPALLASSTKAVRAALTGSAKQSETKAAAKSVAAAQQTKEQKYARMRELLADIARLKSQPGQQAALNAAQAELKQISDSMGGDLPGNESGAPSQTGANPTVIAPAPTGCVLSTTNAANSTPTAIADVNTVTSTITVAGAGSYLWDLNMFTNITHTFAADMDITLTSPAGTIVTISTDNGAGNDNVFAGTNWDDQAGTPVTDFVFANLVVANPLVVEEALGAFIGENPNGTWTLTVTDDLAGDTGTINNWSLQVNTLAAAPPTAPSHFPNNTPTAILDVATVSSNITVAGVGTSIVDMDLGTFITHTFAADMDITLTSPAGTVVTLTTDNGAGNDDVFNGTGWDDNAGTPVTDFAFANLTVAPVLVVEEALAAFQGENPNGTWTLTITDDLAGDTGSLNQWALEFLTSNGCQIPLTGTAALNDVGCTAPGDAIAGRATITNPNASSVATTGTITLGANLIAVPNSCTANVGTCTVTNASAISWSGTLAANQTVTINYVAQINNVPPGTTVCATLTTTPALAAPVQGCITTNCQPKGPGAGLPYTSEMSDQKPGSILIYNIYTSGATSGNTQNTRINITNADPSRSAFVHLFFVAEGCSVADSYLCLTANQTASFLASDLDPGTTGYLVAVTVDSRGCPINMNCLIGDEYVKFTTGHAANLGAEAFAGLAGGLPACDGNSVTATLNFDGVSYNRLPAVLALSNVGSRADGNDTLLILNRIGGNLGIGAATLSTLFGILYDDAENALSFSVAGNCQLRNSLSNNFPRTTPRFETFIPAGRTGWLKVFNQTAAIGMTGAAINFNANAASSAGAFNQGHNLHTLTLTTGSYVIPVFPPSC
ncbi:MAG: proprotein convertase P-domain-containing protein [Blastocatellia bacterium]